MIAVALSPKARALIQAHRDAHRPTAADRERAAAALRGHLGAAVLPLEAAMGQRLMGTGIQRRFAAAFGLCVVGSALFLARRPDATLDSTAPMTPSFTEAVPTTAAISKPSPTSPASETAGTPRQTPTPVAPQRARPRLAQTPAAQDTLAQELALLTSAASQLSAGQATLALAALDEHQRRFSRGVLSDERNLARARTLCILRRFEEGRAELARLGAGTPSAARVKEECDSAWARASGAH